MMRTAQLLKWAGYGVAVAGLLLSFWNFRSSWTLLLFGITVSVAAGLLLRITGNIAQMIFDIKGELIRSLGSIERGVYQNGAMTREVRDILKEQSREIRKAGVQ
ncbi:MAG: hypothetical protein JW937_05845 [Candidatus Omnitrophica bacterium]|nr:hypothetical protein [Candidatus Omnitrophota bacterium]